MMKDVFPWLYAAALGAGFSGGILSLRRAPGRAHGAPAAQVGLVTLGWALLLLMLAAAAVQVTEGSGDGGGSWSFIALLLPGSRAGVEVGVVVRWGGVAGLMALTAAMGLQLLVDAGLRATMLVPGAMIWSLAAVTAAWFSAGHWDALLAQALAVACSWAFLLCVGRPAGGIDSAATAFVREKSAGLLLSLAGIAVTAARGGALGWAQAGAPDTGDTLGLLLLLAGALVQMGVLPALSWAAAASEHMGGRATHALVASQPLGWAAFYVLLRIHPALARSGAGDWLATPLLILSGLTAWSSLAARTTTGALVALAGASGGLASAILFIAGPVAGGSAFLAYSILLWVAAIFVGGSAGGGSEGIPRAIRTLGMLSWAGFTGFLPAASFAAALASLGSAADGAAFVATWVMTVLAGLCLFSREEKQAPSPGATGHWAAALLIILGAAALWSGDPAGVFSSNDAAAWGPAFSFRAFGGALGSQSAGEMVSTAGAVQMVTWAWSAILLLVLALGLPRKIVAARIFSLKLAEQGFGVAAAAARLVSALVSLHGWFGKIRELPVIRMASALPARAAAFVTRMVAVSERATRERLEIIFGTCIEIPAKALQLLQGGSVQAYLLFSLGFGLALLLHFWGQLGR